MKRKYLLKRCLPLIFSSLPGSICLMSPQNVFAKKISGEETIVNVVQTVNGTVRDASNSTPLPGASIAVKGSSQTTSADANGAFTLTVPDNNPVLIVSYIGYVTQEVTVGNSTTLDISLQPASAELAQVVVVGYGTQTRRDVTGSVKSLKSDAFNKGIISSPQQLLQGKVAGVNVTSVSGEPGVIQGITIRGPGGVRTSNTPLFVVDGIPIDNSATGRGDPLNFLNPQDIETFNVLKDASATAIYGARGANGVVIITTKKGKAGTSTLSFSSNLGISTMARKIPMFTASEFRTEVPKTGGTLDDKGASTDWQEEVTRRAITQDYNVSLSGGADKLSYYASFGMQKQEGIIKGNDFNRYTGRFNVTQRFLEDRLTVDANLGVTTTKNTRPPFSTIIGDAISNNPTYPVYDANGRPASLGSSNNPLLSIQLDQELSTINRVIGNISPSLRLIKGLIYKLNFGVDNSNGTNDIQQQPNTSPLRLGRLETIYNYNRSWLIENYLTYSWSKTHHNFSALAGHSYQKFFIQSRSNSINTFPTSGVQPQYDPGQGQLLDLTNNRPTGRAVINELQSFFGRVTYQYNGKYLATANFRADGSTKFGENKKYGYFPSFAVGWVLSEEDFLKNSSIANLKLRAGWGRTGNQEIEEKQTQALFVASTAASFSYPLYPTGAYPAGTIYVRLANPDLQWESSTQTDLGVDFTLLKGSLTGTVDLFHKVTNNILLQVPPSDPIQPADRSW